MEKTEQRFKNIFILSAGRVGSLSLIQACKYIDNYTAGHESLNRKDIEKRLKFRPYHIESDNRLSWMLGLLNEKYNQNIYYVFLKRKDSNKTALSYAKRAIRTNSLFRHFCSGILQRAKFDLEEAKFMVNIIESNIKYFLKDKKHMIIELEKLEDDFREFWQNISAQGDLNKALIELQKKHNTSHNFKKHNHIVHFLKEILREAIAIAKT